jgi:hypothetical protein
LTENELTEELHLLTRASRHRLEMTDRLKQHLPANAKWSKRELDIEEDTGSQGCFRAALII